MSGYPFSYPTQGGQPPPLNQQHPPYQPYTTYPHPASGYSTTPPQSQLQSQQPQTQQYPSHSTSYYANTQSAYEHNASSIPGLGAPQSAPPISMPYNGAWNQGGYGYGNGTPQAPFPAYSPVVPNPSALAAYPFPPRPTPALQTPQPAAPNQPAPSNKQTKPAMQLQPMPQPMPQPKPQPTEQPKLLANNTDIQEDGEIDDGYFDDLYDDASKAPSVANETEIVQDKSSGHTSQDATGEGLSSFDTDMEGVSPAQKKPLVAAAIANTETSSKLLVRDRSMSYSPRLSPDEFRGGSNSESQNPVVNGKVGIFNATTGAPSASVSIQISGSQAAKNPNAQSNSAAVTVSKSGIAPAKPFASVSEAHNEAKKAILRLLPHGVKYQTYIDEGFDAGVIKELFTQLHLPTGPAASASEKPTASAKPTASDKPTATQNKDNHATKPQLPQPTSADTMAKNQEERKDRIARLMAEKQAAKKAKLAAASSGVAAEPELALKQAAEKAKPAAATSSVAAAPELKNTSNSFVAVSAPPVKPPVTKAEKDRLLAQKVEALRAKGRNPKKLAQKPVAPQVPNPDTARTSEPHQLSTMNTQAPVAVQPAAATPLSSAPQSSAASPALSALSSISRAGAHINQRKRPVAADFMDYPAPAVKRPSLANRENSSLVISVSDDEDEDEDDDDVEMEVESATEDSPTPLQQTLTLNRRGPSIRDFPPLKDFSNSRQVSSPVAGMSASSSKNANADLQSKERAIMEMNRRIKELEARKQAKARSGNVTPLSPSAGGFTPTKQASKSASPRAAESKRQSRQHSVASPVEKEGTLAYVKFITDKVKDDELRTALSSHGKLVYFDTNRPKNCAFIEYATPAACQAAIQASPITIAGDSIVIEPRRPKAGHYGSTNHNQTGNTTPSEQVLKTPQRVVAASSSGDDKTSPSAQLLQEAEAASAANPLPEPALSQRQTEDLHRNRNSSAQLSGKSAKALEKAERLRRMQEDLQRLQAEIDQDDDDDEDGDSVNEQRSKEVETTTKFDATDVMQGTLKSVVPEADRGDKVESTEPAGPTAETEAPSAQGTSDVAYEAQPMDIDLLPALPTVSDSDINMVTTTKAVTPSDQSATHTTADLESGTRPYSADSASHIQICGKEPSIVNMHELDDYEPPVPKVDESKAGDGRVCADSPIFAHVSAEAARSGPQSAQEAETAREATDGTASSRPTSFTPYESPLRYYHAYRFHPNYNDGVQGGLKSLTYSNKIDPNKEMCPDEWEGNDCPRGAACQFQHFQSIIVPDSEIILELGSSDEFSGEKKRQFNNGLREVVSSFQKSKVKDFRTIAEAILDFRRKFIGDPSKVLPLEGVST